MNTSDGYVCDNCGCDNPVMATTPPEPDGRVYCLACKEKLRQAEDFPTPSDGPRVEEYGRLIGRIQGLLETGVFGASQQLVDRCLAQSLAAIRNLCAQNDELSKMIEAQCERFACTIDRLHAELDRKEYEHSQDVTELRRRITLLLEVDR